MTGQVTLSEITAIAADAHTTEDALSVAVREHARFVFKVAYSVLRNRDDAEDAAQEAFLRALKHAREFARVEDQRAWLARTVWRIAVDRVRRTSHVSLDDATNERLIAQLRAAELRDALDDAASGSAEALLITDEMTGLLHSLIAALPRDLRDVITLSTVEEMTSAQISAVLGISDVTVRTRLLRARLVLKEKLAGFLESRMHNEVR